MRLCEEIGVAVGPGIEIERAMARSREIDCCNALRFEGEGWVREVNAPTGNRV